MQKVSKLYERIFYSQNYYTETSLLVGNEGVLVTENSETIIFGADTAIIVTDDNIDSGYRDTQIVSIKTTKRVFKNNLPEVGCCPCGEIYIEMIQPRGSVPRKAIIVPYVRLVSKETGETSEWIKKGVYYLDTRENTQNDDNLNILTMHGYDAMMFAEQPYGEYFKEDTFTISSLSWSRRNGVYTTNVYDLNVNIANDVSLEYVGEDSVEFGKYVTYTIFSGGIRLSTTQMPPDNLFIKIVIRKKNTLGFPATDLDVVYDIAGKMGVEVDERSIPYINQRYSIEYPAEYTMRETLGYIGAMYGGNWVMNDIGELQFISLWDLPEETNLLTDELGYRLLFGDTHIIVNRK